jgi:hypothetical protein
MKKQLYNLIICSTLILTGATSCSLDESPKDQVESGVVYTSANDLYKNAVSQLYGYVGGNSDGQGLQGTCRGVYDLNTFTSDEALLPTRGGDWYDGGMWQELYEHSWSSTHDLLKNSWNYLYKVIVQCNRSLGLLNTYRSLLTDKQYTDYQAEIRAFRAMYYYYVLDLFARVPIVTDPNVSMDQVKQSERSDVFRFVYKELIDTYPLLTTANSTKEGDNYGRITRPVAMFLLAKLALNATVYLDDKWTDKQTIDADTVKLAVGTTTMNPWKATEAWCDSIEDYGYTLEDKFSTNFSVNNENSKENIYTIPMDKNLYTNQMQYLYRSYHYRQASAYGFTAENGSSATTYALKVFGYGTSDEDARFTLTYYADTVYDLKGKIITDRTGAPLIYRPWSAAIDVSDSTYKETAGARMRKYEVDKNAPKDGKLMDNDIVLFRFADVLLMRAEARLRGNFNILPGLIDLNSVRSRVGMPVRELTLENILNERLLELAWEGWRRQDQIRFGEYFSLSEESNVGEQDHHTIVFPIPYEVKSQNQLLKQNDGYQ